ncbi:MAG: diaminopimelate epimerase, partial [Flavobacteriaceae bacterium]|nr:diaminopimelate epimerase [Flavobacteriaceae bacterium]
MAIEFYKYQGTGNDFIIVDNRNDKFPKNNTKLIAHMCDRKFGIGADGLILLENHDTADFNMVYYNSDGNLSSMCGNGGRCITHFAKFLGIIENQAVFEAIDGMHESSVDAETISLRM